MANIVLFFGSIFEGDATLLGASFLAHRHVLSLAAVIATATIASLAWNECVFYFSGRRARGFLERRVASHPAYERVQLWVQRRSVVLLLFSRYLFGFRLAIPVACGATGISAAIFSAVNAVGASDVGCSRRIGWFLSR
jgi:membrane protein DedA with SNARE-associated domain